MKPIHIVASVASALVVSSGAGAQNITDVSRNVTADLNAHASGAQGYFNETISSGADNSAQSSIAVAGSIFGHFEGHAYWPAPGYASSSLTASIEITEPSFLTIDSSLMSYKETFVVSGGGTAKILIKNGGQQPIFAQFPAPPYGSPASQSATLALLPGSYTVEVVADGTASGSSIFNGVNAHSVIDLTITWQAVCGAVSAQSCFEVHAAGPCSDATCCSDVCEVDPGCCVTAWDRLCVDIAAATCSQGPFSTDFAVNPINGHRIALTQSGTWQQSEQFAAQGGADLVTIESAAAGRWLGAKFGGTLAGQLAFIGLNDMAREGTWTWDSGERVGFTNWALGEPSGGLDEDGTAILPNGQWGDVSLSLLARGFAEVVQPACGIGGACDQVHGPGCSDESCCNAVCTIDPYCCEGNWDASCVNVANERCGTDVVAGPFYDPHTNHRYFLIESTSWHQAEKAAIGLGGHLATIDSMEENEWARINFGVGLLGHGSAFFIGGDDEVKEAAFRTPLGGDLPFTRWADGEPNNSGNEDFIEMQSSGFWNDLPVSSTRYALVEASCLGDFNENGWVDGADLAVILGAWGVATGAGDLNGDAIVDAADLALLLGAWGPCPTSNACMPRSEPGADLPGCTFCVCEIAPECCNVSWDFACTSLAAGSCNSACHCN